MLLALAWNTTQAQHKSVYSSNGEKTVIEYDSKITLADDDKSIIAISDFGYFRFKKDKREIYIKAEAGGKLAYTYYVHGRKADEAEGKAWFATQLPKLVRRSGFAAEARVARFYKKGGTSAVLTEAKNIESNYARGKYYRYLLKNHPVKDAELTPIVTAIDDNIKSDYEKGKILRHNHQRFLKNEQTANAYVTAVGHIKSDYEKSKALRKALESNLSEKLMTKVLDASMDISSDYEKSKILRSIISKKDLTNKELDKVLTSTAKINSSYEKSKVIRSVLNRNKLSDKQAVKAIDMTKRIGSDYEKSKVLRSLLSKSESTTQFAAILDAVADMGSDYEKAKILIKVGRKLPDNNSKLKDHFTKVAKSIGSDHEYGKVMRSLNR